MAALPDAFTVRRTTDRWVIIGPTGLFLVSATDGDPDSAAEQTAMDSHVLRNKLAEVMDMVPFVDPVVVSRDRVSPHGPSTLVEAHLLTALLLGGPPVIGESELQLLRHHVPVVLTTLEANGGWH